MVLVGAQLTKKNLIKDSLNKSSFWLLKKSRVCGASKTFKMMRLVFKKKMWGMDGLKHLLARVKATSLTSIKKYNKKYRL